MRRDCARQVKTVDCYLHLFGLRKSMHRFPFIAIARNVNTARMRYEDKRSDSTRFGQNGWYPGDQI